MNSFKCWQKAFPVKPFLPQQYIKDPLESGCTIFTKKNESWYLINVQSGELLRRKDWLMTYVVLENNVCNLLLRGMNCGRMFGDSKLIELPCLSECNDKYFGLLRATSDSRDGCALSFWSQSGVASASGQGFWQLIRLVVMTFNCASCKFEWFSGEGRMQKHGWSSLTRHRCPPAESGWRQIHISPVVYLHYNIHTNMLYQDVSRRVICTTAFGCWHPKKGSRSYGKSPNNRGFEEYTNMYLRF